MGYRLNRLDEPVFMAVSKPLLTEFGIHHRLESCAYLSQLVELGVGVHLSEPYLREGLPPGDSGQGTVEGG